MKAGICGLGIRTVGCYGSDVSFLASRNTESRNRGTANIWYKQRMITKTLVVVTRHTYENPCATYTIVHASTKDRLTSLIPTSFPFRYTHDEVIQFLSSTSYIWNYHLASGFAWVSPMTPTNQRGGADVGDVTHSGAQPG